MTKTTLSFSAGLLAGWAVFYPFYDRYVPEQRLQDAFQEGMTVGSCVAPRLVLDLDTEGCYQ